MKYIYLILFTLFSSNALLSIHSIKLELQIMHCLVLLERIEALNKEISKDFNPIVIGKYFTTKQQYFTTTNSIKDIVSKEIDLHTNPIFKNAYQKIKELIVSARSGINNWEKERWKSTSDKKLTSFLTRLDIQSNSAFAKILDRVD